MFCLEAQKDTRLPNARKKAISVFPPDMPDGTLDRYTRPNENFVLVTFETSGGKMESDSFEEIRDVVGDVLIEAI